MNPPSQRQLCGEAAEDQKAPSDKNFYIGKDPKAGIEQPVSRTSVTMNFPKEKLVAFCKLFSCRRRPHQDRLRYFPAWGMCAQMATTPDARPAWMKPVVLTISLISLLAALLLMLRASLNGTALVTYTGFGWLPRSVTLPVGLAALVPYFLFGYRIPLAWSRIENTPTELGSHQRFLLQERASSEETTPEVGIQMKILALVLLRPPLVRQRVSEHWEPGQRTLRKTATVEVQIPRPQFKFGEDDYAEKFTSDSTILLPIIISSKGKLHDDFVIRDLAGNRVPILTHSQYLQLIARLFRMLLLRSYGKQNILDLPSRIQEAERSALDCAIQRGVDTSGDTEKRLQAIQSLILDSGTIPVNRITLDMFTELTAKLATGYALVAPLHCDPDRRISYTYEYTVVPAIRRTRFFTLDPLRFLLGARPVDIDVDVSNSWASQTYHLIVTGGEGLFCLKQEFNRDIRTYLHKKNEVHGVPAYYRFRKRLGQPYVHFYTRFFPEPTPDEVQPRLRIKFREVPPGSTFRATVAAIAASALVWIISLIICHSSTLKVTSDAPAFFLAFPAIAAAWMGFEARSNRLLEATLAARVSLFVTAAISIGASGLFMVYSSDIPYLHGRWPGGASLLGVTQWSWSLLTLAAMTNAAIMAFACFVQTCEFRYLACRQRKDQEAIQNG